jgi:hypothetical protein
MAYQLATLFHNPIRLPLSGYLSASIASLILVLFCYNESFLWIYVLALSIGLQGIREAMSEGRKISTFKKRLSRILGFAISVLFNQYFIVLIAACVILLAIVAFPQDIRKRDLSFNRNLSIDLFAATMVVHQSHYFSYAYFIPYLFLKILRIDLVFDGVIFAVGWVSYSIAFLVYGKKRLLVSLSVGHFLASMTLGLLFVYSSDFPISIIAWFLSGFGGGTVYCLKGLQGLSEPRSDLDLWESIGHIFGLVISLLVVWIFGPLYVFLAGAMLAMSVGLLTTLVFPFMMKKRD